MSENFNVYIVLKPGFGEFGFHDLAKSPEEVKSSQDLSRSLGQVLSLYLCHRVLTFRKVEAEQSSIFQPNLNRNLIKIIKAMQQI